MLEQVLRLIGVDLQAHIAELKVRADAFKTSTMAEIKAHVVAIGVSAGLIVLGAVFALITNVIGFLALYRYLEINYGPFAALGGIASATAFLSILLISIGISHAKSDTAKQFHLIRLQEAARQKAIAAQTAAANEAAQRTTLADAASVQAVSEAANAEARIRAQNLFSDQHFYKPLTTVVSTFFGTPPITDSTLEKVAHQVTSKLASKSEETVAVAAHVMRTGPKSSFYGVLAASAFLGFMLTRPNKNSK